MRRVGPLLGAVAILLATGAALALAAAGRDRGAGETGPAVAAPNRAADEAAAKDGAGRSTDAAPAVDPDELARISVAATPEVARRVERIRGLEFARVPRPEVVGGGHLRRLTEREQGRRGAAEGVAGDEAAARITGLLAPDEQLEDALTAGTDLAAAAYDTRHDRLYVVSDAVVPNRALVEFTLAHELDHALEDQRFGLPAGGRVNDDGALARVALSEGSATAVMSEYASRHLGAAELLAATGGLDAGTGDVPRFVVDQLLWTYLGGRRFIDALYRIGGGWKLVDYALRTRPPRTTEQVLHPRSYLRDERAPAVRVSGGALRERGWRPAGRGVLGELGTGRSSLDWQAPKTTLDPAIYHDAHRF
ncbi:MAG: hypothetical protein GEU88_07300, partial [Solirubrobacterales bacterium]|nr:hypothetical protein [Solirubrobacterales bacterium]